MKKRTEVFEFTAYMSPPPANARGDGKSSGEGNENFQTEEHYANVKECGFNRLSAIYEYDEAEYLNALKLCDKLGLEFLVRDQHDLKPLINERSDISVEERFSQRESYLKARFDKYAVHPSFAGVLASDEPHSGKFSSIRFMQDWFMKNYPNKDFEINLLPDYANGEQLTGIAGAEKDYQKYVDDFTDIVCPQFLSYDHYALLLDRETGKPYLRESYLKNLEVIAKKAKEQNLSFSVFLLTLGHWSFRTVSSYREIAWQVYTAMAYGAKGAQTFTYWTMLGYAPGNPQRVTSALVSADGKLLPAWYAMKEVISEVRAFEKEYLTFFWKKSICFLSENPHENKLVEKLDKNSDELLLGIKTTADLLVGCFEKESQRAYLVSNLTDPAFEISAEAELLFAEDYVVTVYKAGKKDSFSTERKKLSVRLRSGEGIFIVLKEKKA